MAYAVEITGLRDGKVMGNLYELDGLLLLALLGRFQLRPDGGLFLLCLPGLDLQFAGLLAGEG